MLLKDTFKLYLGFIVHERKNIFAIFTMEGIEVSDSEQASNISTAELSVEGQVEQYIWIPD